MLTKNSTGTDLYYEASGSGEAVIMCAGATSTSYQFKHAGVDRLLAEHYRVLLVDYTGLGASGRVESVSPTQWCEDVISVLDAEGVERAHVMGISLGSRVAARVAFDYPDRVATLVVDAPLTHVDPDADAALNGQFADPDSSPRKASWIAMHGDDWREVIGFYARVRKDQALQQHITLRPYLSDIAAPTLVTHGDRNDVVHPLLQAFEWHQKAERSWMWIAPGSSQAAAITEFPALFTEVFNNFKTAKKA